MGSGQCPCARHECSVCHLLLFGPSITSPAILCKAFSSFLLRHAPCSGQYMVLYGLWRRAAERGARACQPCAPSDQISLGVSCSSDLFGSDLPPPGKNLLAGYAAEAIRWSVPEILREACAEAGPKAPEARIWATMLSLAALRRAPGPAAPCRLLRSLLV